MAVKTVLYVACVLNNSNIASLLLSYSPNWMPDFSWCNFSQIANSTLKDRKSNDSLCQYIC